MIQRTIATLALVSMIGTAIAPAYAKTPGSLSDLVGSRAPGAESEMQDRGYKMETFKNGGQYWWNGSSDTCVRVVVSQGRYASIDKVDASDCGKGGGNAAAAVGTIAAIGLIAALASHKKKHDDGGADHDREYSRGYNDGLYGGQYDRNDTEPITKALWRAKPKHRTVAPRTAPMRAGEPMRGVPHASVAPTSIKARRGAAVSSSVNATSAATMSTPLLPEAIDRSVPPIPRVA